MKKNNKRDKLASGPSTTGSFGTSGSSNVTIDSSGLVGDEHNSLFPNFHESKNWVSKTDNYVEEPINRK